MTDRQSNIVGIPPAYAADFDEYDADETILRYRRATAGEGINHLLKESYGPLLLEATRDVPRATNGEAVRIVEFGCGAGMAIQHLLELLRREHVDVELAVGADFVPAMIDAANRELDEFGDEWMKQRLRFVVATNEDLAEQIAAGLQESTDGLAGSFHLALGVNTFRYPVRHGTARRAAAQLELLLRPGGRVVVIDMNDRFPYGLKPKRNENGGRFPYSFGTAELPTLDGYAAPFRDGDFDVLRKEHFSWIPHSARGIRFRLMRAAAPVLNRVVPDRAMRSLVIARRL